MIARMGRGMAGLRGLGYRQQACTIACAAVAAWLACKIFWAFLILCMLACASLSGTEGPSSEAVAQASAHARARIVALTTLAGEPGEWSLYYDGDVEVLSKGTANRTIPRPVGLDPRTSDDVPRSGFALKDGVLVMRLDAARAICRQVIGRGTDSRFATRPLEFSLDRERWSAAGTGTPCEDLRGKERLFVRAAPQG